MTLLENYALLGAAWAFVTASSLARFIRQSLSTGPVEAKGMSPADAAALEKSVMRMRKALANYPFSGKRLAFIIASSCTWIILVDGVFWIYYAPRHFIRRYLRNRK